MDFFDRANQGKALRKKKAAMHNDGGGVDKAMDVPEFVCGLVRLAHAAGLACFPLWLDFCATWMVFVLVFCSSRLSGTGQV